MHKVIDWNEIFVYKDGDLYWKETKGNAKKGSKAGYLHHTGYVCVGYQGKSYRIHRIIWEMHNWPIPSNKHIDHADRNKTNNRIENLRCCSHAQNAQNMKLHVKNISGHRGVTWYKPYEKWNAYIMDNNKRKHLGYFDDVNDAIAARKAAEQQLQWNQY